MILNLLIGKYKTSGVADKFRKFDQLIQRFMIKVSNVDITFVSPLEFKDFKESEMEIQIKYESNY